LSTLVTVTMSKEFGNVFFMITDFSVFWLLEKAALEQKRVNSE